MDMKEKIKESFRLVKNDIMDLQKKMTELSQQQELIVQLVSENKVKDIELTQEVKQLKSKENIKVVTKKAKKSFFASKTGNKVHVDACPFGKNISPKNRVVFKSKVVAFNRGYKPCECMKKV